MVADSDLSAKQGYILKVSAAGKVDLCGDGECPVGVLLNKPSADGQGASIATIGDIAKVICAEGITAGAKVASDTDGKAVAAAATDFRLGIALDSTSNAGEYVSVLITLAAVANA